MQQRILKLITNRLQTKLKILHRSHTSLKLTAILPHPRHARLSLYRHRIKTTARNPRQRLPQSIIKIQPIQCALKLNNTFLPCHNVSFFKS